MTKTLISIEKISKFFIKNSKKHYILNNISLEIYKGECLGIIGPSGSGKTTLCSIIQGLITPSSGNLFYYLSKKKQHYPIQTIFQDPESSLNPRMSIYSSLKEPLELLKKNENTVKNKIEEVLDFVGLNPEVLQLFPHQISGGQKQRITIARALLSEAELIICDEPTSSLDPVNQNKILLLFQKIKKQFNITFLFVSHDLLATQFLSDRIAVMEKGSIIEINNKHELLRSPQKDLTKQLIFYSKNSLFQTSKI